MALRRGDVAAVDELLPEWTERALASEEPQRTIPMAAIALARAALANDAATVRALTETVLTAVADRAQWAPLASAAIPRAMYAVRELELLERAEQALTVKSTTARSAYAVALTCRGLCRLADGHADEAVHLLRNVVELETERGAAYHAACAELDFALALDAVGDAEATTARARANQILRQLGCINAV